MKSGMHMIRRYAILLTAAALVYLLPSDGLCREEGLMDSPELRVYYPPGLDAAAREVMDLYPVVRSGLESALFLEVDFKPAVILVDDMKRFELMAGQRSFVAYALPEKNLIVIDYTRMHTSPFTLSATLKHELCHLLLHRHIAGTRLPSWLDEGVAQWISDGMSEMVFPGRESVLTRAVLTGRLFRMESLTYGFPQDPQGLALAYEQSRSFVNYIVQRYGKNGILTILESMRKGADYRDAIRMSLRASLHELEDEWRETLRTLPVLLSYAAGHLYTLIFIVGAILTFWAYIRFLIRKRRLKDEPDDEQDPMHPEE